MQTQHCPRCAQDKTEDQYHPDKWGKPGHYCRPCVLEYKTAWRRARGVLTRAEAAALRTLPPKPPRPLSTTYRAVHRRLSNTRGPARNYQCQCGKQAKQWAYDHTDPRPLSQWWNGGTVEYSADLDRYAPLCPPCHTRLDARRPH